MKKSIKITKYYWNIYGICYYDEVPYKYFITSIPYSDASDMETTIKGVAHLLGETKPFHFMEHYYKYAYPMGTMTQFDYVGLIECNEDDLEELKPSYYYARYIWANMPFTYFPAFFITELSNHQNLNNNLV